LIVRVSVAQERRNELAEKVRLPVGSEPDTSQMSRFETPAEQPVGGTCDLEVAVGIHRRTVRELCWVEDPLAMECHQLVVAESG
jgi:hypothetical protein